MALEHPVILLIIHVGWLLSRLFRTVSKPRPSDHPLVILFVIGGITCTEVRQIRDVVSAAKSNVQVSITYSLGESCVFRWQKMVTTFNLSQYPSLAWWLRSHVRIMHSSHHVETLGKSFTHSCK